MFISTMVLVSLSSLPFLYIVTIFSFWGVFGAWTCLFSIIPLWAFVYVFSNPLLVHFSLLLCTFLSLVAIDVSLDTVYYNGIFWGCQFFLLSMAIVCSIYKTYKIPKIKRLSKQFSADGIVVVFDPVLHTIKSISSDACKIYGWKRRELVGKTLSMIYTEDIFDNPPFGFWEALNTHQQWCGTVDVVTKNNTIFEEVAYYTVVQDKNKKTISIEKKALEIFVKDVSPTNHNWYQQFYEDSVDSLAIVNKNHQIEFANPSFIKEYKPILNHTTVRSIFHKKIVREMNRVFRGEQVSIEDELSNATLIFSPYYCPRRHNVSHVLLRIKKETHIKKENISKILKKSLTKWHLDHKDTKIKLFFNIKVDFLVPFEEFMSLMRSLYEFTETHIHNKHIIFSCDKNNASYRLSISFKGAKYSEKETLKKVLLPVFRQIDKITSMYRFEEGIDGKLLLIVEFLQK